MGRQPLSDESSRLMAARIRYRRLQSCRWLPLPKQPHVVFVVAAPRHMSRSGNRADSRSSEDRNIVFFQSSNGL
jgi:hypothetical protein